MGVPRRIISWGTTLNYSNRFFLMCRAKLWLFVAYVVSFVCLAGSVGLLVQDALTDKGPSVWTGVAGVLQCVFVLIRYICVFHQLPLSFLPKFTWTSHHLCSGLTYWTCHSDEWGVKMFGADSEGASKSIWFKGGNVLSRLWRSVKMSRRRPVYRCVGLCKLYVHFIVAKRGVF